jgi:hypothetical protein
MSTSIDLAMANFNQYDGRAPIRIIFLKIFVRFHVRSEITPRIPSMIPDKKRNFGQIKSNTPHDFVYEGNYDETVSSEKDCFNLLTSQHAQRQSVVVHVNLPTCQH